MKQKVAIIGGGILGASLAYYLGTLPGNEQLDVTLYDSGIGQATKNAAGIISPWLSKRRNQRWYRLAKDGATLMTQLARQANLSNDVYQQSGTIVTRTDEADLQTLLTTAQERAKEAPDMGQVTQLTAAEVQARIPLLTHPQPGVFISGGARLDGAALIDELLSQAQAKNLTFLPEKVDLDAKGDIVRSAGTKHFDRVVVLAGAHTADVLKPLGVTARVRAQKGELIELSVKDYPTQENMPVLMPEGERDFIPFGHGKLVVGATHDDEGGFDLTASPAVTEDLLASAQHLMANLSADDITQVKVGTRAYTDDFAPFFGAVPQHEHVLVASGLGSSGLTTGPVIARLLASKILYNLDDNWDLYTLPVTNYIN